MHRRASGPTTATSVHPVSTWDSKEKVPTRLPLPKEKEPDQVPTLSSTRSGGFYDQKTLWEQELHRYHPSFWLLVRVGSLLAFPHLASALGTQVYPHVVAWAETHGWETQRVVLPLITALSMAAFFAHNALYGLLYHFQISSLDRYRVDDKPWHWQDMDPESWREMLRHTVGLILFNFLGVTFPLLFLRGFVGFSTPVRSDVASLPGGAEILWQLLFCLVLEDFGFHHAHALLHTKRFYWIHKIHHRYHAPIAISAAYAHPIEYLLGNILPSLMGPMILRSRMHIWTFGIWTIFRGSAAIENHSGYEFPWSLYQAIPFKAPTEYHDFHHNRNQETYSGVLRFWDWVYGTNRHYFEWVQAGRPDTLKTQKFKARLQKKVK